MQTRLQRKHEKDSLKQAGKYILLTVIALILVVKFGLPALVRLAGFVGDLKSSSEPIEKADSLAPVAPTLLSLPEATNSAKISVAGYTETGVTVKLSRGGIVVEETVSDSDGNFEFKDIVLKEGNNEFMAEGIDSQGNSSEPSKTHLVTFDNTPPQITVNQPEANKRFFDKDSPIVISGQTEVDTNLTINAKFVRVDNDGSFNLKWPLSEGDNQLDFLARDSAGNETKKLLTVNYTP